MEISFGSDPEFMIFDSNNIIRSAIGIVPGEKERKCDIGNGHLIFCDNVNLEINIKPATKADVFIHILQDCFNRLHRAIAPYYFLPVASADFPASELKHEKAMEFGCEPEACAYTLNMLTAPNPVNGFRSAGGHIHLGVAKESYPLMCPIIDGDTREREMAKVRVVRMLDLFLGIPSVLMDHDPTSSARRKLYGKAGSHRAKDYGVEYRSIGNFWLTSPTLVKVVFDLSIWTVNFVSGGGYESLWQNDEICIGYSVADVRKAIDETNQSLAADIMNKIVKRFLPDNLFRQIFINADPTRRSFRYEWGF